MHVKENVLFVLTHQTVVVYMFKTYILYNFQFKVPTLNNVLNFCFKQFNGKTRSVFKPSKLKSMQITAIILVLFFYSNVKE